MTPENEAKKQYLLRYRQAEREIRLLHEELAQLESMAVRVTPSYSGETRSSGSGDRVGAAVDKIVQCEEEINEAIDAAVDVRAEIKSTINALPDTRLRELLVRRYLLGQKWEQVAWEMHLEFRWVRRLHGRAIDALTLESPPKSVL